MPARRTRPVYNALKVNIVNGRYGVGESLDVRRLETEYNVSSIPIREALIALAADGLVDFVPGRGFSTVSMDVVALSHHLDIVALMLIDAAFYICSLPRRHERFVRACREFPDDDLSFALLTPFEQASTFAAAIRDGYREPHMLILERSLFRCAPALTIDTQIGETASALRSYLTAVQDNRPSLAKRATRWFIARQKKRLPHMLRSIDAAAAE